MRDERGDEARLADAGRPCEADRVRPPRVGVERLDEPIRRRVAVLDERDRACEGTCVAGADTVDQALRVVVHAAAGCGSGSTPRANSQARPEATPMPPAATTYVQRAPIAFVTGPAATNDVPSAP